MKKILYRKFFLLVIILTLFGTSITFSSARISLDRSLISDPIKDLSYVFENTNNYYSIVQNLNNNFCDNNTVTIRLKSGMIDKKTGEIKGIVGHTICIENNGKKKIWFNSSEISCTLFNKTIGYCNWTGGVLPNQTLCISQFSLFSLHPIMFTNFKISVTYTNTSLVLERSAVQLFTCFYICWTGPESVSRTI